MTISDRIKQIRAESKLSQEEFAASIGIKRANLANIEVGKQLPTLEQITAIVTKYHKSYEWLIDGKGSTQPYVNLDVHRNVNPTINEGEEKYTKPGTRELDVINANKIRKALKLPMSSVQVEDAPPIQQVVDTTGLKVVPIVEIRAAAGQGVINPEYLEENDVLRLPAHMIKSGNHLCVRIKGTSMAPTLQDGGYVVIRYLDRTEWATLPNERINVVVDNEGHTYLKRVKNRLNGDKGFIVLTSDSPDKVSNPSFNLHANEIAHIWNVEWYFTAKMPNIHDQYYSRVSNLEDKVDMLVDELRGLQKRSK